MKNQNLRIPLSFKTVIGLLLLFMPLVSQSRIAPGELVDACKSVGLTETVDASMGDGNRLSCTNASGETATPGTYNNISKQVTLFEPSTDGAGGATTTNADDAGPEEEAPTVRVTDSERACVAAGLSCNRGSSIITSNLGDGKVKCSCRHNSGTIVQEKIIQVGEDDTVTVLSSNNAGAAPPVAASGATTGTAGTGTTAAQGADAAVQTKIEKFVTDLPGTVQGTGLVKVSQGQQFKSSTQILTSSDSMLGRCEMILDPTMTWADVSKKAKDGRPASEISGYFTSSFAYEVSHLINSLKDLSGDKVNQAEVNKVISGSFALAKVRLEIIQKCTAMAYLTTRVDYNDPEAVRDESEGNKVQSLDGKIKAVKTGGQTQDFPACKKAIGFYDAALVGGQVMQVGQSFQFQEASMDASIKAQENADDVTAGMKAQQEMVDEQKKIADQRTVFSGAKLGALFTAFQGIPTMDTLISECQAKATDGSYAVPYYNTYVNAVASLAESTFQVTSAEGMVAAPASNSSTPGRNTDPFVHFSGSSTATASTGSSSSCLSATTFCKPPLTAVADGSLDTTSSFVYGAKLCEDTATDSSSKTELIKNEVPCRQAIKKAMMDAGVEVAENMLKAKLLDDQSDLIGDAINNVKQFEDDNPPPQFEDLNTDICNVDPTATECANVDPVFDRSRSFSNNGIGVGGGFQRATSGGARLNTDDDGNINVASDDDKGGRGSGVNGIGTTIGAPNNGTGFVDAAPAAASMKKGGGGAGGGGGGGGGVGAAASSGAGGGALGGGGGNKGATGPNGRRVAFAGTGKGSLSFGGGRGGSRKAKSKSGNPFSKLFKNKKGGAKGKTLNYRGVASVGKKKDSLFGMISSRYNKISDERLIKYKLEEGKK